MMGPDQPITHTRYLIEGQPVVIQCNQCESMIKEVMAQDRLMAQLKRDLRNLETLVKKAFGLELNRRPGREFWLRDRSIPSREIRPYTNRQEKLKICMSPRVKFARLRELRLRVQPSCSVQTMPEHSFHEEQNIEEVRPTDSQHSMEPDSIDSTE